MHICWCDDSQEIGYMIPGITFINYQEIKNMLSLVIWTEQLQSFPLHKNMSEFTFKGEVINIHC